MSLTEFAMVEELAFLIKDNLPCKHLILSIEEALVNFLQNDTCSNEVLELEPMNSYNRLLIHRLADIFGFSHQSVGEGDERHLVLERCSETSVPSVLVSDLLWHHDDLQSPMYERILTNRSVASPEPKVDIPTYRFSLEEREAAYLSARQRIFSVDEDDESETTKQRPRHDPVVARRMIAHALGQRMKPSYHEVHHSDTKEETNIQVSVPNVSLETCLETTSPSMQHQDLRVKPKDNKLSGEAVQSEKKMARNMIDKKCTKAGSSETERNIISKDSIREQHIGAAKRMFANALGVRPRDGNLPKSCQTK